MQPRDTSSSSASTAGQGRFARLAAGAAAFALATFLLVAAARQAFPPENVAPDFIQFWTAATLLVGRQDPYDPTLQAAEQQKLGWDRTTEGLGVYDFLPYYYPPWLGLACAPLLPLGYPLARLTWLVLGLECLFASALLLRRTIPGIPAALAIGVIMAFGFSIKAVAMGQVAPIVLLLMSLAWWLLERGRDRAAGAVLALLTIKPQLTLFLLAALMLWAVHRGRRRVVQSFAASIFALAAVSTIVRPDWLPSMLAATRATPMPTAYFPGLGTTWYAVLGALGVGGPLLLLASLAAAAAVLGALARTALRGDPLERIFGLGAITPFFVAPYARPYDFPVLLIPALILMGSRLSPMSRMSRSLLTAALTLLTALHIAVITTNAEPAVIGVRRPEFTYFWIPLLIAGAWWRSGAAAPRTIPATSPNREPALEEEPT